MPKVSIIIPTYNQCNLLRDTIYCVLAQTEKDFEVIIVDDGSTDDTRDVVHQFSDNRVKYFYKSNGGTSAARNFGLSKAQGGYIAFLDHDDLWPDNYLSVITSRLDTNDGYGLAYSPITVIYPDGKKIESYKHPAGKSGWITLDLFKHGFTWPSAAIMKRTVLDNIRFDESLRSSYEDGDFFLRLSTQCMFLFVGDVEAIRREHSDNLSAKVGIKPTRILVLERFYYQLGGKKYIPAGTARRRLSHATRKVAEARRSDGSRAAAIILFKHAIKYRPFDVRLYAGLFKALKLKKENDPAPNWRMPEALGKIEMTDSVA